MSRTAERQQLYFLVGNAYSCQKKLKEILPAPADTCPHRIYHGWEFDLPKFIEEAQTYPFLAEKQILIIKEAARLPKAAKESLKQALAVIPPFTAVVFEAEDIAKDDALYTWAAEAGVLCLASDTKPQPEPFIRQFLKKAGKSITPEAVDYLIKNCGGDEGLLAEGLEKLVLYARGKKEIGREEVTLLSEHGGSFDDFDLVNAFTRNQITRALAIAGELFELSTEAPAKILGALNWHFKRLWRVQEMLGSGLSPYEIGRELRMPSQYVSDFITHARRFSRERLRQVFEALFELDGQIKRGMVQPQAGIETFLIRFSG